MANSLRFSALAVTLLALVAAGCSESSSERPAAAIALSEPAAAQPRRIRRREGAVRPVDPAKFGKDEMRVAVLLPLSGGSAPTGQALFDAMSLALFDAFDPRLRLLPFDTLGTPSGAAAAARKAVETDPEIIIGPLFAESITAAAPIVKAVGLRLIGFSNDRSVASGDVLLLSFLPEDEIRRVVRFAAGNGVTRFAGLIPDSPYGEKVLRSLSDSVRTISGTMAGIEFYVRDPQETANPVKRLANYDARHRAYLRETAFLKRLDDDLANEILKSLEHLETLDGPGFDAVLVPEGGDLLRSLAPMLSYYEVDPKDVHFLGTGLWDDAELRLEPSLDGAWFAGAPLALSSAFLERFETTFGYQPARIASLGYDAMSLVAILARHEVRRERFSDYLLFDPNGFDGVDGIFRFRRDGTAERGLAVLEIRPDGFRTVSPAPISFNE
jgi:outer membrane PBP1 activator LpoA protein